jgi:hypothetical protein
VRNAEGRAERYPALAAELIRLKVDVIVVQGNAALATLKQATQTIPIVMANIGDPVGAGFVSSLALERVALSGRPARRRPGRKGDISPSFHEIGKTHEMSTSTWCGSA